MMFNFVELPSAFLTILLDENGLGNIRGVGQSFLCLLVMHQQSAHGPFW